MPRNRYFDDVTVGEEITLDIDLYVEDWLLLARPGFMDKLHELEIRFNIPIRAWYRKSSHDNVHIKMKFPYPLSMLECLLFRAWFDDDRNLLYIDMKRYFKTMDSQNKFMRRFDCKGKILDNGDFEIKQAGAWIQLC